MQPEDLFLFAQVSKLWHKTAQDEAVEQSVLTNAKIPLIKSPATKQSGSQASENLSLAERKQIYQVKKARYDDLWQKAKNSRFVCFQIKKFSSSASDKLTYWNELLTQLKQVRNPSEKEICYPYNPSKDKYYEYCSDKLEAAVLASNVIYKATTRIGHDTSASFFPYHGAFDKKAMPLTVQLPDFSDGEVYSKLIGKNWGEILNAAQAIYVNFFPTTRFSYSTLPTAAEMKKELEKQQGGEDTPTDLCWLKISQGDIKYFPLPPCEIFSIIDEAEVTSPRATS